MKTYFVCADIHSYYDEWQEALTAEGFSKSNPNHIIIMCGDLFDRGPKPLECFEFAQKMAKKGRFVYVRGNHEDLLFDCYDDLINYHDVAPHHISNGTLETIAKFTEYEPSELRRGLYDIIDIIEEMCDVLTFIRLNSVDYYEIGDKVFCHGWIPEGADWRAAPPKVWQKIRWENGISNWFFDNKLGDRTIYCGHWHCSYGWALKGIIDEEFPADVETQKIAFSPFVGDGIVALDGCTAFSGIVNVVKFETN